MPVIQYQGMTLVAESAHFWIDRNGGAAEPLATVPDDSHRQPVISHVHTTPDNVPVHHHHHDD